MKHHDLPSHPNYTYWFIILIFALYSKLLFAYNWTLIGNQPVYQGYATENKIALAPNGTPYVAFLYGNDNKIKVYRLTNNIWEEISNSTIHTQYVRDLNIAVDHNGNPIIAYEDNTFGYKKASVMQYSNGVWQYLGPPGFSNGEAISMQLAIAPDGTPFVAYRDYTNGSSLIVKKFYLLSWITVGKPNISDGYTDIVGLAISPTNIPYVAYAETADSNKRKVKKFDGCNWLDVGFTNFSNRGVYGQINLAISKSGVPYVAFNSDILGSRDIVVTHYVNNIWEELPKNKAETIDSVSLQVYDETPYITFISFNNGGKVMIMEYKNGIWNILENKGAFPDSTEYVNAGISSRGVLYYVAFLDTFPNKVIVMGYL